MCFIWNVSLDSWKRNTKILKKFVKTKGFFHFREFFARKINNFKKCRCVFIASVESLSILLFAKSGVINAKFRLLFLLLYINKIVFFERFLSFRIRIC